MVDLVEVMEVVSVADQLKVNKFEFLIHTPNIQDQMYERSLLDISPTFGIENVVELISKN